MITTLFKREMSSGSPKRRRGGFRRLCISVHLWLGLTVGLLWAIQGLTGALLVFHREADRIGGPALTDGPMLPVGTLIAAGERIAHAPLQRLTAVSNDPRLVEARYLDPHGHLMTLELDAATARLVGRRDRDPATPFTGSGWRWIYLLHMTLMAGETGRTIIGISGLLLISGAALGLYVGWPGKHWRQSFAVSKWRVRAQKLYGWHRLVGLVAALGIMLLASTGAYMTFGKAMTGLLLRIATFDPSASMAHSGMGPMSGGAKAGSMAGMPDMPGMNAMQVTPDQAMATARTIFPAGKFMNLELPAEHQGYYSIRFTLPGEWRRWSGRALVQIDAGTGAVLEHYDPLHAPLANRFDDSIYPIHLGEAAGLLGRILTMLAGLALPTLYVTGLWRWLRRRRT